MLPQFFSIKTLNASHCREIFNLIRDHYVEDDQGIIRLFYHIDFLYWYLKQIPPGLLIGLVYRDKEEKLVGIISGNIFDIVFEDQLIKMPYINLLCVQKRLRELGFAALLINEIREKIKDKNYLYAFYTTVQDFPGQICTTTDQVIPINIEKFKKIGFIGDDDLSITTLEYNPLRLVKKSDIPDIVKLLNQYLKKYKFRPYFTDESAYYLLLPRKNIVYSFVRTNNETEITDFIMVYSHHLLCLEKNETLNVAQLAFYFNYSMSLTELVILLLDKLTKYNFDQLTIRNFADNIKINHDKLVTHGQLNYYLEGNNTERLSPENMIFHPV